jgi:hypothetical protein
MTTVCIGTFHRKLKAPAGGCAAGLRGLKSGGVYTIARGIVTPNTG